MDLSGFMKILGPESWQPVAGCATKVLPLRDDAIGDPCSHGCMDAWMLVRIGRYWGIAVVCLSGLEGIGGLQL